MSKKFGKLMFVRFFGVVVWGVIGFIWFVLLDSMAAYNGLRHNPFVSGTVSFALVTLAYVMLLIVLLLVCPRRWLELVRMRFLIKALSRMHNPILVKVSLDLDGGYRILSIRQKLVVFYNDCMLSTFPAHVISTGNDKLEQLVKQ